MSHRPERINTTHEKSEKNKNLQVKFYLSHCNLHEIAKSFWNYEKSRCVNDTTGCPITKPIRCGDQCKDKSCREDCEGCIPAFKQDCPV